MLGSPPCGRTRCASARTRASRRGHRERAAARGDRDRRRRPLRRDEGGSAEAQHDDACEDSCETHGRPPDVGCRRPSRVATLHLRGAGAGETGCRLERGDRDGRRAQARGDRRERSGSPADMPPAPAVTMTCGTPATAPVRPGGRRCPRTRTTGSSVSTRAAPAANATPAVVATVPAGRNASPAPGREWRRAGHGEQDVSRLRAGPTDGLRLDRQELSGRRVAGGGEEEAQPHRAGQPDGARG